MPSLGSKFVLWKGVNKKSGVYMKGFKFLMMLIAFAMAATACSKSSGGGAAPAPVEQDRYYYQGNYCYDRNTGSQCDVSYCGNGGGGYQNQCIGWVYYTNYQAGYMDRVDCRNPNAYYVECRDPEAYIQPGEVYHCEDVAYGSGYTTGY